MCNPESCQVGLVLFWSQPFVYPGPAQKEIKIADELAQFENPALKEKPEEQLFGAGRPLQQGAVKINYDK
jgi:alpha-D-ribose 1-methylphosphonate 5-phosphate C-P lyase